MSEPVFSPRRWSQFVGVTGVALAVGPAQADVARYQTQSATLTISLQPQYPYVHVYDITLNPCDNTFTGVSDVADVSVPGGETISGTLNGGNITFTASYNGSTYQWTGSGALTAFTGSDTDGNVFTTLNGGVTNLTNVSNYKNHGAFVSASADKNDAAHSCIGMPVNSNK